MEMHQLRYFARVAELGNITRAAEACFVSQPSLSQQLAKLETELGQPLFERLGRGIRLTEAGRVFRDYAEQILRLTDDAKQRVADDDSTGRLTLGAIPTIAPYLLPRLLVGFSRECPKAKLEIVEETTGEILKRLNRGELDLALVALPVNEPQLAAETLFVEELVAVMPPDHRLAGTETLTVDDLRDEPFVLLNETHCLTGTTLSFCRRHAVSPIVTGQMQQLSTVLELVRLGQGISVVPEMAAKTVGGGLICRRFTSERPTRTVGVVRAKMRFQTKLFQRFVRFVRQEVGE